jgi:phage tail sheath protein FI
VNPAAFAAGIISRTEVMYGVPHGPAMSSFAGAVDVTDRVNPGRHAVLHQSGVDVYLLRTDGIWLMGARTVSRDPAWRQLSVRRVVSLVERTVLSELAWTVFEPNDRVLRGKLELLLGGLLRQLFAAGAFAGATPAESYFVRTATDAVLPLESSAGQLVCQIGLAVAEPLEFIVVTISRDAGGALTTETFSG